MTKTKMQLALLLGLISMLCVHPTSSALEELKGQSSLLTYIVHVKKPQDDSSLQYEDLHGWYNSLLPDSTKSLNQQHIVFLYKNVVDGFAVKLTPEEAKVLEEKEEVVSARPQKILSLHTTHTPSFLGLQQGLGLWKDSNRGKGIIIGIVDTGIFPSHPSFSDGGMPFPPAKWNGICEFTGNRTCNNKLLGARNFVKNSNLSLNRSISDPR